VERWPSDATARPDSGRHEDFRERYIIFDTMKRAILERSVVGWNSGLRKANIFDEVINCDAAADIAPLRDVFDLRNHCLKLFILSNVSMDMWAYSASVARSQKCCS